ncbi:unnamed protein product [Darwinula stevensoni]|uniref:Uncharacterized protein n=1 Tax=Darwinula stevensoni TaxID=69355 RepID=A0A7R9FQ29_9CRUS|nr:unnamed protein product [Darwinula stevensoni]CAG0898877.1 unnamed protein product [Darwinula stevensoni]
MTCPWSTSLMRQESPPGQSWIGSPSIERYTLRNAFGMGSGSVERGKSWSWTKISSAAGNTTEATTSRVNGFLAAWSEELEGVSSFPVRNKHLTVNHKLEIVNQSTYPPTHKNTIEGMWRHAKLKQGKFDFCKRFMDDAFVLFKDGRRHPSLDVVDDEKWMLQYLGVLTDSENPEEDTEDDSSSTDL